MQMNKLRPRARFARGFTLIELMLVVSLIGIMSAIAVPSVLRLMQDRRSQRDAMTLLVTLQDAHTRAFGRGAAVVLTMSKNDPDPAVVGISESSFDLNGARNAGGLIPNPACNGLLPASNTAWWQASPSETDFNVIFDGSIGAGSLAVGTPAQLCFTPRGETMGRTNIASPWVKVDAVIQFEIKLKDNTGITRRIDVLPNGLSRMRL